MVARIKEEMGVLCLDYICVSVLVVMLWYHVHDATTGRLGRGPVGSLYYFSHMYMMLPFYLKSESLVRKQQGSLPFAWGGHNAAQCA